MRLESLRAKFEKKALLVKSQDMYLTFDEVAKQDEPKKEAITRAQATDAFLDLLVFAQANFCDIKQSKMREPFSTKFSSLQIYKTT